MTRYPTGACTDSKLSCRPQLTHREFRQATVKCPGCEATIKAKDLEIETVEKADKIYAYTCTSCGYRSLQNNFKIIINPDQEEA